MLDVDLLKIESLIGMIDEFKVEGNLPLTTSGMFPTNSGQGENFSWDIMKVQRDIDTFEGRFSPAGTRTMQIIGHQSAKLARSFKSTFIPGAVLMDLRNPGSMQRQAVAESTIAREMKALNDLLDRQNEYMMMKALQGSLSMTIDKIAHTVDYAIPATQQFTIGGTPGVLPLAWDDVSADILEDIRVIVKTVKESSGWNLTRAWCSKKVLKALFMNDFTRSFFEHTPAGIEAVRSGVIGDLFGLRWQAYDEVFLDASDVTTRYLPENRVIFTPEPSAEWGFMRKGSDVIPNDAKTGMQEVIGRYGYSDLTLNPVSIALYIGEVRLPIIRIPSVLAIADVLA